MSRKGALVPFPCPVKLGRVGPRGDQAAGALHDAVMASRLGCLRKLLKTGIAPDLPNDAGQTPLFMAAITGQSQAVEQLLHCGADPNRRSEDGATPVHAAAFSGGVPVLLAMLGAGGDLRLHDAAGRSPTDWAFEAGPDNRNVLELLGHCKSEMLRLVSGAGERTGPGGAMLTPHWHPAPATAHHASLRRLLRFGGPEEELQLGATDARSRSCLRLENLGYGMVCAGPGGALGYAAFLPMIPANELYRDDNHRCLSYANGPLTLMTSLVWSGTEVTVRDVGPERGDGAAGRAADLLVAEQEAYSGLRCAGLLLLMGVSLADGLRSPRLVFERVQLGSLYSVLHERKLEFPVLRYDTILRLLLQVCAALRFLHARGLLHAGLSSHAVQLVAPDTAKLSSLEYALPSGAGGHARRGRAPPADLHRWLPLEVLRGQKIGAGSDVYSYCAIIYEILSDSLPWAGVDAPLVKQLLQSGQQMPMERPLPEPWLGVVRAGTVVSPRQRSLTLSDIRLILRDDLAGCQHALSSCPAVTAPPVTVSPPAVARPLGPASQSGARLEAAARDVTDARVRAAGPRPAARQSASAERAAEPERISELCRRGRKDARAKPGGETSRAATGPRDRSREKPERDPEASGNRKRYQAYSVTRGKRFEVSLESGSSLVEDSSEEGVFCRDAAAAARAERAPGSGRPETRRPENTDAAGEDEASLRQMWSRAVAAASTNPASRREASSEAGGGFLRRAARRDGPDTDDENDAAETAELPLGARGGAAHDTATAGNGKTAVTRDISSLMAVGPPRPNRYQPLKVVQFEEPRPTPSARATTDATDSSAAQGPDHREARASAWESAWESQLASATDELYVTAQRGESGDSDAASDAQAAASRDDEEEEGDDEEEEEDEPALGEQAPCDDSIVAQLIHRFDILQRGDGRQQCAAHARTCRFNLPPAAAERPEKAGSQGLPVRRKPVGPRKAPACEQEASPPAGTAERSGPQRAEEPDAAPGPDDSFVTTRRARKTPGAPQTGGSDACGAEARRPGPLWAAVPDEGRREPHREERRHGATAPHRAEEEQEEESEGSWSDEAGSPQPSVWFSSRSASDTREGSRVARDDTSLGVPSPSCRAAESTPKQPGERTGSFATPASTLAAAARRVPRTLPYVCSTTTNSSGDDGGSDEPEPEGRATVWSTPHSTEGTYETARGPDATPAHTPAPSGAYDTCLETQGSVAKTLEWRSTDGDSGDERKMETAVSLVSAAGEQAEGTAAVRAPAAAAVGETSGDAAASPPRDSQDSVDEMNSAFLNMDATTTAPPPRESTRREEVEPEDAAMDEGPSPIRAASAAGGGGGDGDDERARPAVPEEGISGEKEDAAEEEVAEWIGEGARAAGGEPRVAEAGDASRASLFATADRGVSAEPTEAETPLQATGAPRQT